VYLSLPSLRLFSAAPLMLAVLVACQAPPTGAPTATSTLPPAPATTGAPASEAGPAHAPDPAAAPPASAQTTAAVATAVSQVPAGEQVTLAPVNAQVVLVDQVGYLTAHQKVGLVAEESATTFQIVDVQTNRSVYAAALGEPERDPDTGQRLRPADFSSLTQPGTYSLQVAGVGRSPNFRVGDDVYQQLSSDALNSYEQLAVLAPQAWQTATAQDRKTGQTIDTTGGWPDAGDYGRYMPSAASALGTMLLLDDIFPQRAQADQLQVFKRELDWMLKMQRTDGAVYHKVTPLNFGGFDKGSDNIGGQLYAFEVSTPDAAVFTAIAAEAARVYRPFDAAYADRLQSAAEVSWRWLQDNPKPILPAETEGTGSYVYSRDGSQRFWAAAELFKTTGDPRYEQYVETYLDQHPPSIGTLGWGDPETYGVLSVAFNDAADPALRSKINGLLTRWADGMVTSIRSSVNPWALSISSFHWASNKTSLDNATLLLIANFVRPNAGYVEAALDQLHYVLGRNALAKSYVTGYGTNSVQNPHNRTMFSLGRIVPGVLVGGPNGDGQDGLTPPSQGQRSYVDQLQAYASNENSIEYNAPLVFVTTLFGSPAPH
jgi:endoglucanase